ncbi:MAG: tetratricopeptide repeat protein [Bacteroidetes bacterium]|nr:tetratricopeptide repeat protein [Bacteroidota bacterium]
MRLSLLFLLLSLLLLACGTGDNKNPFEKQLHEPPYGELSEQIDRSPKNDSLYYQRALLLIQNEQPVAARLDLEKAWSLCPMPDYALALASLMSETINKQADFLKKAVSQFKDNFLLEWALADTYQQLGQPDSAIRLTEKWIPQANDEPEFVLLHARLQRDKNKMTEALTTIEQLHQRVPAEKTVTEILALWYAELGVEKAIPLCEEMKAADSLKTNPLPYYYLGILYDTQKKYELALTQFDKAIINDYNFVDAYIEKSSILYQQKKWSSALDVLAKALAIAPNNASVYYWTAKCQQALGDKESARLNYLKAYGLDKSLLEAKQAADQLK